jgi:hypothetical protein
MLDNLKTDESRAAGVTPQERRINPRYAFSASAEAVHLEADTRLNGRVSDLSRGGCYVDTLNPFPLGANVKVRILKDNMSFVAEAKVLYSADGMGMGLGFTKIEPERLLVLERWLAELSGELRRAAAVLEDEVPIQSAESEKVEQKYVLNELIIALMRKKVLTDAEGKAMLKKLMD